jgi:hypothetical protein
MFTGEGSLAPTSARFVDSFQQEQFVPSEFYSPAATGVPPAAVPRADVTTRGLTAQDQMQQTQEPGFKQKYPMLSQLLRSQLLPTALASLPTAYFASQARREGRGAERELRAMAQPIREQAEALRQQALSGGLTPQQARQQEARRAQLRQSAAGRGAVTGTQQAMIENTLARERAGLAQTNLENAMRQLNLANTVTEAAIRARLTSDRDVNQAMERIYTNLIRSSTGQRPNVEQSPAQPTATAGGLPEERLFPQPTTAQR